MELFFAEAGEPALTVVGKGHGRLERRRVWVSGELAGYTDFPGLATVVMVRQETEHLSEGRRTESVQYGVSSLVGLEPDQAWGCCGATGGSRTSFFTSRMTASRRTARYWGVITEERY